MHHLFLLDDGQMHGPEREKERSNVDWTSPRRLEVRIPGLPLFSSCVIGLLQPQTSFSSELPLPLCNPTSAIEISTNSNDG